MLNLETRIKLDEKVALSPNLTDRFTDDDLTAIGQHVWAGYDRDSNSRIRWVQRTQSAMDLALQVVKEKNFPWAGCSNIAFPLVTIATLQFHSRAYPAIVQGPDLVRYRVVGEDPQGQEKTRAERVGQHMSFQLLEEDQAWEEQHDRLLINIPIVGCAFKKTYFSGSKGHNVSELVLAQDFVLDYYAKSVEDCARKTHIIPMYRNQMHENILTEIYRDVREEAWYARPVGTPVTMETNRKDIRTGVMPPQSDQDTPFRLLEQHCWLDFDGDGYAEPYIVTIEETTRTVLRIVARWDKNDAIVRNYRGEIIKIVPTEYFTKYGFIPSPDGGIYDMGFGNLLGPLNESANSLINQLVDAGTMANTAGGFLGRGAKIRGGVYTFAPLEWKRVDATGDDLKKSIMPLPVREPSNVLFQLLSLLINYTQRISGSTDTLAGENPGQNTAAETTNTMVEQGLKIYSAIFKRIWRSMKEEFKKLYKLNATFLPDRAKFGDGMMIAREDYLGNPDKIVPAADPNVTSERARLQQAMTIKQAAMSTPGYNLPAVERNFLRALRVESLDVLYPGPDKVPPIPNPKVQIEQFKMQTKQQALQLEAQKFAQELMEQRRVNSAKILQLEAQAAKLIEEAGGVKMGHQIAAFDSAIGALKAHDESLRERANFMLKSVELDNDRHAKQTADRGGMEGMGGAPGNPGPSPAPQGMAGI